MNSFACKKCNKKLEAEAFDIDCITCCIRYHIPVVGQPYKYTIFENDKIFKDLTGNKYHEDGKYNYGSYEAQITVGKTLFEMYQKTGKFYTENFSIKSITERDNYTFYYIYSKNFLEPNYIRNQIIGNLVFK